MRFWKESLLSVWLATCGPAMAAEPLQRLEYAVYSALLRHGLPADTPRVVLMAHTYAQGEALVTLRTAEPDWLADFNAPPAVIADLIAANESQVAFERSFDLAVPYELLTQEDVAELFSGEGWSAFYSRYPSTPGILRLSRIGFDETITHALVMVEQLCGTECGWGRLIYLSLGADSEWHVHDGELLWIAGPAPTDRTVEDE